MATDARGHTAPASGETPRRQALNDLSLSINDIVRVANATARAQAVTDIVAAGHAWPRPLYVHRDDATVGYELERTVDGVSWLTVAGVDPATATFEAVATNSGNMAAGTAGWGAFPTVKTSPHVDLASGSLPLTIKTAGLYTISATQTTEGSFGGGAAVLLDWPTGPVSANGIEGTTHRANSYSGASRLATGFSWTGYVPATAGPFAVKTTIFGTTAALLRRSLTITRIG